MKSHDHAFSYIWVSFIFELVFHINYFSGQVLNSLFIAFFKKERKTCKYDFAEPNSFCE